MLVGYVLEYGHLYGERLGRKIGSGKSDLSDPFQNVIHLEWAEWGPVARPVLIVPGLYVPGRIPGN